MENGDISSFPKEMFRAFDSKQILVTPSLLNSIIGSEKINLENYDIYTMGKKKNDRKKHYWTKLRIKFREHSRNGIQGYLSVSFIAGYGFQNNNCESKLKIIRPTSIGKMVSDDGAVFKKRSMIDLNGTFIPLQSAEGFCSIPLLSSRQMKSDSTFKDSKLNSNKRKAYASCQIHQKKWAHINRRIMENDQKKSLHSMLLPYKKNLPDKVYFNEFINDIVKNINLLKKEFGYEFKDIKPDDISKSEAISEAIVSETVVSETVVSETVVSEAIVSKDVSKNISTETLYTNLDSIPMSTIEW